MGVYTTFHVIYGIRLPDDLKHRETQEDFDPDTEDFDDSYAEEFEPYMEESDKVAPFVFMWQYTNELHRNGIFGQRLCCMGADRTDIENIDVGDLRTDEVKRLYRELFREYDIPDAEPQLLCIVEMS